MNDTQSMTESLLDIVKGIDNQSILLPEFQRDFRWEMNQTYDLFDSLIRNIFIGTIIYGKPSFSMTVREIDKRPRRGTGSRRPLNIFNLTDAEMRIQGQTKNLKLVLDGQQRITSIYRAIVGIDKVFLILRRDLDVATIAQQPLEEMFEEVTGEERPDAVSVQFSYAYEAERDGLESEEQNEWFSKTLYARTLQDHDSDAYKDAAKLYRRAISRLKDLFKQQKMVAYYLLDMDLEKFCLFFERSNSRGIQLNFIDILVAKLYPGLTFGRRLMNLKTNTQI